MASNIVTLLTKIFDIKIVLSVCVIVMAYCLFMLTIGGWDSSGIEAWLDRPLSDVTIREFLIVALCFFWASKK